MNLLCANFILNLPARRTGVCWSKPKFGEEMNFCIIFVVIFCLDAGLSIGEPVQRNKLDLNLHGSKKRDTTGLPKRKVIIDTDMGIDDTCALILAFSNPDKFDILAVTTTAGNVPLTQVIANANRVKRLVRREDVPVYKGSDRPLLASLVDGKPQTATEIHGKDGLGDTPDTYPPYEPSDYNNTVPGKHAAQAMIELVHANPGCTIICLGPLANLALAIKLDPTFADNVEHVFMMGGNIRGVGNVLTWETAEFNYMVDPEAANIVLTELGRPITVLPWEMVIDNPCSKDFQDAYTNNNSTAKGRFVHDITRKYLKAISKYGLADEMAMSIALDPSIVFDSINKFATVELSGKYTRGQIAIDFKNDTAKISNAQLVSKVNLNRAEELLLKSLDDN